ncbi:unnamed protein product [Rhodiola kirilowii]
MSLLAWNCRGIGTPLAIRALKDVVTTSKSQIVGLIETKASVKRCEHVRVRLGFRNCFSVPARGKSGGLALYWTSDVEVTICNYSFYHIDFIVHSSTAFRSTLFYGAPRSVDRGKSWDLIRKLRTMSTLPWCLIGDFNEILRYSDMSRNAWRRSHLMAQFRAVLADCQLSEVGYTGSKYTYSNRRQGSDETKCRLDRALATPEWRNIFKGAEVRHLTTFHSDHRPIQLCFIKPAVKWSGLFRFETMWTRDQRFKKVVSSQWSLLQAGTLMDKLEGLKAPLTKWNKRVFGNVNEKLSSLKAELTYVQELPRSADVISRESALIKELDEWLSREEQMWQQRSRVLWLREGDNNTAFFHQKASARRKTNTIVHLRNTEGALCYDQSSLETIAVRYFQQLFTASDNCSREELLHAMAFLPRKVTASHNRTLTAPYVEGEIFAALSQLNPSKAPGLDGFPAGFFQTYWDVVKIDFVNLCLSVLNSGDIPERFNDTLLVLIPKQKRTIERMEDLRPISLTSVVSRVVAKVMVNRLQAILSEVISTEQSAFVKSRLITDNFIIAHECSHFIKNYRRGATVYGSLKLDMSKAYDRIEWNFLEIVLLQLGFDMCWVRKVMKYVKSVRYCVRVNGAISGFFTPGRGLRQGDPLSPYLFIICTEWLSYKLHEMHRNQVIPGLRICRKSPYISHLFFADDAILFFKATVHSVSAVKNLLTEYEQLSGQVVNFDKSEFVLSPNAPAHLRNGFRDILSVQVVSHHAKYLGLPVVLDRHFSANFTVILDRICGKVGGWSSSFLSCGGKEILIKAVLQAIPQYFMHCFLLPDCILNKIQSLIHNFWWRQSKGSQPIHWVKASWLATSKEEGGLGFKNLKLVNIAFLAKQAWRLYKNPHLLLSQVLRGRYYPDTDIFNASIGYRPSKCWRSILGAVDLLRAGCDAVVGGSFFWKYSSSEEYDVRSGYQLAVNIAKQNMANEGEVSNPSRLKVFWKLFWKLPVPRKVKIFGWRCYHNGLPVGNNLFVRNISTDVSCPICNFAVETDTHIFLHCWWSKAIWDCLNVDSWQLIENCSCMADVLFFLCLNCNIQQASLCLVGFWYIWFMRNRAKHGDKFCTPAEAVARILSLTAEFRKACNVCLNSHQSLSDFEWKPPARGIVKINCDASWDETCKLGGVAAVARDYEGSILGVRAAHVRQCLNSFDCEGLSVLEGLRLGTALQAECLIVESDCAEVVACLNQRYKNVGGKFTWFSECLRYLDDNPRWSLFLIRREANSAADQLAKRARRYSWSWNRLDACPFVAV